MVTLCMVALFSLWVIQNQMPRVFERMSVTQSPTSIIKTNQSSFKLLQFADLHLGESVAKDAQTLDLMRFMMTKEQPDFVAFTGDQVSGYAVTSEQKRLELWSQALAAVSGTPFATLFGNHDDQPYGLDTLLWHDYSNYAIAIIFIVWSFLQHARLRRIGLVITAVLLLVCILCMPTHGPRSSLLKHERHNPASYSQQGSLQVHGVSNYRLVVQAPHTRFALYFLDSGGGRIPEAIHADQIQWLQQQSVASMGPSVAFVHIAPQQYKGLYTREGCTGKPPGEESSSGSEKLLDTLHAMGTRAVFVGHDHDNAWCCPYRGMQLCYGQHSGYGGYHNPAESARGARIIHVTMLNESRIAVETWIQMNQFGLS